MNVQERHRVVIARPGRLVEGAENSRFVVVRFPATWPLETAAMTA